MNPGKQPGFFYLRSYDDGRWFTLQVRIYPNPASDQIEFETSGEGETLEVTVLDVSGRKVFEKNVSVKDHHGKLSVALSQGLYFIHIQSSSNERVIKKVVIAK